MNQATMLFQLIPSCRLTLTGEGLPAYWQRQMVERTSWLKNLQFTCTWVETVNTIPPRLNNEPLLGRCLTMPIDQVSTLPTLDSAETRIEPLRYPWTGDLARRDRPPVPSLPNFSPRPTTAKQRNQISGGLGFSSGEATRSQPPALFPSQLEPQADRTLLSRLAAETIVSEGLNQPSGTMLNGFPPPRDAVMLPVPPAPTVHPNWQRDLVRRVRRSLNQNRAAAFLGPEFAPPEPLESGAEESLLADQWVSPLSGQVASSDLLAHLVSLPGSGQGDSRSRVKAGSANQTKAGSSPQQPLARRSPSPVAGESPGSSTATSTGVIPQRVKKPILSENLPESDSGIAAASQSPIELPTVRTSLSNLLPPQEVATFGTEVASAMLRWDASKEETGEEDLSLMADQIKRILDEEARRHGIDV
jgi:hypothetical protein